MLFRSVGAQVPLEVFAFTRLGAAHGFSLDPSHSAQHICPFTASAISVSTPVPLVPGDARRPDRPGRPIDLRRTRHPSPDGVDQRGTTAGDHRGNLRPGPHATED